MNRGPNPKFFLMLACASLVLGGGAIYWQSSQLSEAREGAKGLRNKLRDERATELEVATTTEKVQESQRQLDHLEMGVPELAYIPTLLTELESVGKQNGIAVLGVRPVVKAAEAKKPDGTAPKKQAYEELNIEVKGRGNYLAVAAFLEALRTFPKIVAVRTVTLSPKSTDHGGAAFGSPSLDATVEIRAFLFAEPAAERVAAVKKGAADRRDVADQMVEEQKK